MDVHPANAAADALGDLFPHEAATLDSDGSSLEWLSGYVEDCFSSSTSYTNPLFANSAPSMANQSAGKPKLLPPSSSNARRKKRSLASVMSDNDDQQQYIIPLYVEPPLLLIDQKHWMAESELIHPKKDNDQELCQQQEQGQEEEKCEKGTGMQFQRERMVKRCSNCLSCQTPRWRHGPSGPQMLCNACGLRLKPENRFATISKEQYGQETSKEPEPGKLKDKKKKMIRKTYVSEELPSEQPEKRCTHCMSSKTPQWRTGPLGPKTLCNACGVRFKSGRLLPEYRPANSPTFVSCMHSNSHKKVMQLRLAVAHKGE